MQELIIKIKESHYKVFLKFLKTLEYANIIKPAESKPEKPRYDFSDLSGKLKWEGDPVKQQQQLRDEW